MLAVDIIGRQISSWFRMCGPWTWRAATRPWRQFASGGEVRTSAHRRRTQPRVRSVHSHTIGSYKGSSSSNVSTQSHQTLKISTCLMIIVDEISLLSLTLTRWPPRVSASTSSADRRTRPELRRRRPRRPRSRRPRWRPRCLAGRGHSRRPRRSRRPRPATRRGETRRPVLCVVCRAWNEGPSEGS